MALSAMTHIARFFLSRDFFALDPFLSHDFLRRKNALCVHGTIEIALERIQRDIAANSRRQKHRKFALCVSWALGMLGFTHSNMFFIYSFSILLYFIFG